MNQGCWQTPEDCEDAASCAWGLQEDVDDTGEPRFRASKQDAPPCTREHLCWDPDDRREILRHLCSDPVWTDCKAEQQGDIGPCNLGKHKLMKVLACNLLLKSRCRYFVDHGLSPRLHVTILAVSSLQLVVLPNLNACVLYLGCRCPALLEDNIYVL